MTTSRTLAPGASRLGTLYCSFCRKDKGTVSKLIAGPGVYICNECVGLCNLILAEEKTPELGAWNEHPDDELLAGLGRIQAVVSQVDAAVDDYVEPWGPRHQLDPHRGGARRVQAGGLGSGSPGRTDGKPGDLYPGQARGSPAQVPDSPQCGVALIVTEGSRTHVQHILTNLGLRYRSQIAAWASGEHGASRL